MLIGCGFVYVIFADANLQSWNSIHDKEMQPLKKKNNDEGHVKEQKRRCNTKK